MAGTSHPRKRSARDGPLFAGVLPQLLSRVVSHVPLDSWLAAFGPAAPAPYPPPEPSRTSP